MQSALVKVSSVKGLNTCFYLLDSMSVETIGFLFVKM